MAFSFESTYFFIQIHWNSAIFTIFVIQFSTLRFGDFVDCAFRSFKFILSIQFNIWSIQIPKSYNFASIALFSYISYLFCNTRTNQRITSNVAHWHLTVRKAFSFMFYFIMADYFSSLHDYQHFNLFLTSSKKVTQQPLNFMWLCLNCIHYGSFMSNFSSWFCKSFLIIYI